jgi:hypothetical protein
MLLRLALEGDWVHLAYGVNAVLLIPSLALACGVLTGTNRTFELLYMIAWYLGPFNHMPLLDFLGGMTGPSNAGFVIGSYLLIMVIMLGAAAMKRSYRSRSTNG